MAHTFEYSIMTAIPDARRGERVNIGVIVFRPERIDVRFSNQAVSKLRALTGESMPDRLSEAASEFERLFKANEKPSELIRLYHAVEPLFHASDLGWFRADTDAQYEDRISEIQAALVSVPTPEKANAEGKSHISTEIADAFRKVKLLAAKGEGIENGKVIRHFHLGGEEDLVADFALKNGKYHIASTLDLRFKSSADMGESAIKSFVFVRAIEKFKKAKVRTIGVFAVDAGMYEHYRRPLKLFEKYADDIYDWSDAKRRKALNKSLLDAIGPPPDAFV